MKKETFDVKRRETGMCLREFLRDRLGISGKKAKALLDARNVFVNGMRVWMAGHRLAAGDRVAIAGAEGAAAKHIASARFLFRDEHYLVADKPPAMLSDGPASLEALLRGETGNTALRAVHRLDRDTSGCLLFALSSQAFTEGVALFRSRRVGKLYHAIVAGRLPAQTLVSRRRLDGEHAATKIRVLDGNSRASHILAVLETGRTHQIRRHLAALGCPVLGDKVYATGRPTEEFEQSIGRQMLHAFRIVFPHPFRKGETVRCEAPLPADFRACLRMLGLT